MGTDLEAAPLTLARCSALAERLGVAYFDGWLLVTAFSIFTFAVGGPLNAVEGQPLYYFSKCTHL